MTIPKIIHQLWIGPKQPPTKFMDTWKDAHEKEGFEYIRWTKDEFKKRNFVSKLVGKIDDMIEINGKADIIRWEILYEYGGVFIDADAYCIEPVTYLVEKYQAFAGYENEKVRNAGWAGNNRQYDDVLARTHALIATGTMAFPPKHNLPRLAIEWIKNNDINVSRTGKRAWRTVGPGLLTRLYYGGKWEDMTILPSYLFLPIHNSGLSYNGREKIYAHQEWGSTKQNYHLMDLIELPSHFKEPIDKVSILISSLNTKAAYIKDCLNSIKNQNGHIFFEIIWINDGSDEIHTKILKKMLDDFENTTRFVKIVYSENDGNKGLGYSLNKGVNLCNNEIILRMDSDDIMFPDRIIKQFNYMNSNKECVLLGSQIVMFIKENNKIINKGATNHKNLTLDEFKKNKKHWLMNHPTFCFRKSKIIEIGNYNNKLHSMCEDFELILRVLNKYKKIHNINEPLLYYRMHNEQLTYNGGKEGSNHWNNVRNDIINQVIS